MNFFQRILFRIFPPKTIPIIINGGDVSEAGHVNDHESCLMTTALRRREYQPTTTSTISWKSKIGAGFGRLRGPFGIYNLLGKKYEVDLDPIFEAYGLGFNGHYDPSIIGTKFTLTRI